MEMTYINKSRNGLKNKHKYICEIIPPCHGKYVYDVHFIYDCNDNEEINLWLQWASELSLRNNFKFDKLETE